VVNEALMELGALVCLPRQPRCGECPVREFCRAGEPESLPVKKAGAKTREMAEDCLWVVRRGQVLLELQTGPRWKGLWKLPPAAKPRGTPVFKMTYPFTNHRVTLAVYPGKGPDQPGENQRWFTPKGLEGIAITAPHRRAIGELLRLAC
jgi:A/G-specific adenine glycosylase